MSVKKFAARIEFKLIAVVLLAAAVMTFWEPNADAQDRPLSPDMVASQAVDPSIAYWGECDKPAWLTGAFQLGGQWLTNAPAWYVPAEQEEGVGSLFMVVDRSVLTNDLTMELTLLDKQGSSLYLDLLTTNMMTAGTNLFGNLIQGSNTVVCMELALPVSTSPLASVIRLWRGRGEILVFESQLYLNTASASQSLPDVAENRDSGTTAGAMPRIGTPAESSDDQMPAVAPSAWDALALNPDTGKTNGPPPEPRQVLPGKIVYVDQMTGDDCNSGVASSSANDGPKKTVHAGLAAANNEDIVVVREGNYGEDLNVAGRNVTVFIEGTVNLSSAMDIRAAREEAAKSGPVAPSDAGMTNRTATMF